jgi:T-complex protein 1 subunit theta
MASGGMFRKQGAAALMKDGHSHFAGVEEAVLKNIEACKAISVITKTSVGPNGMRKMIIDHLEKCYVTSDTAIIQQTLEVGTKFYSICVLK